MAEALAAKLKNYRKTRGVSLQAVCDELAGTYGCYGPTWLWRREQGEVGLSRAQFSRIVAAVDAVVERRSADPADVLL